MPLLELDKDGIPEGIMELLKNPTLWTVLYHAENAPFIVGTQTSAFGSAEGFGFGQPNVRKAGWGLLMTLLQSHKGECSLLARLLQARGTILTASLDRAHATYRVGVERSCAQICLGRTGYISPGGHVAAFIDIYERYVVL